MSVVSPRVESSDTVKGKLRRVHSYLPVGENDKIYEYYNNKIIHRGDIVIHNGRTGKIKRGADGKVIIKLYHNTNGSIEVEVSPNWLHFLGSHDMWKSLDLQKDIVPKLQEMAIPTSLSLCPTDEQRKLVNPFLKKHHILTAQDYRFYIHVKPAKILKSEMSENQRELLRQTFEEMQYLSVSLREKHQPSVSEQSSQFC